MLRLCSALLLVLGCSTASARPGSSGELRVMAYNVLYDAEDPPASVALIAAEDPDVVCLREVRRPFERAFLKRLAKRYPHRVFRARRHGTWGVAFASKHPIVESRVFEERPHGMPALDVTVKVPRIGRLRMACLHLIPPVAKHRKSDGMLETMEKNDLLREKQALQLLRRFSGREPLLLVGDFNEERGPAMTRLAEAGFQNACDAPPATCGKTWPGATSPWPAVVRIDHVLGRGVRLVDAWVPSGGGSDHQPIVATVRPAE